MKLHSSKINQVITEWANASLVDKEQPLKSFVSLLALKLKLKDSEEMLKTVGCLDKDGYIDLDYINEIINDSLATVGGKVYIPILDWNLDKQDIENILQIAKQHGV